MKKLFMVSILLFGISAMAQIPQGSICISPERLSVSRGTKSWVYLDQGANSPGKQIWESGYSGAYAAGLFDGIIASARIANRFIIINPIELQDIQDNFGRLDARMRLANAIKIDVNRDCEASAH